MQIRELLCEGERSDIFVDPPSSSRRNLFCGFSDYRYFMVPYTEIPRWLNSKHQSVGNNLISFHVGRKFPNVFVVYFASRLGPQLYSYRVGLNVYLSINGFEKVWIIRFHLDCNSGDTLQISSRSHLKLQKLLNESNPSDYNHVEVTYVAEETYDKETDDEVTCHNNPRFELIRWGVKVECICCPQKSSISSSMALTLVDNDSHSDLNLPLKKRRKY